MPQNKTAPLLVLALVSWPWIAEAQWSTKDWRSWKGPLASKMCAQRTFLVEVEEGTRSPCPEFAERLAGQLATSQITTRLKSFESQELTVQVDPIFPKRQTQSCLNSEGSLRFFTVRWRKAPGQYVEVPPAAVCETVATIRRVAQVLARMPCAQPVLCDSSSGYPNSTKIRVARDCPLSAYAIPAYATPSMKNWHTKLLGVPTQAPPLNGKMVLVDSGG